MRRKQMQVRVRVSARLKEKQAASTSCFGAAATDEGSSSITELYSLAKRHKAKGAQTKLVRMSDDESPVRNVEENGLSSRLCVTNGDATQSNVRSLTASEGLCAEKAPRLQRIDMGKEDSSHLGHCLGDRPERQGRAAAVAVVQENNSIFVDEDSNEIMPLGQFFGNLELVQDYPPRPPLESRVNRREYRRLHFIARDDSDEDTPDDSLDTEQRNVPLLSQFNTDWKNYPRIFPPDSCKST